MNKTLESVWPRSQKKRKAFKKAGRGNWSFSEGRKVEPFVKGQRYRDCPKCRGVGGNHDCPTCRGAGTARIRRKKTGNGSSGRSSRGSYGGYY